MFSIKTTNVQQCVAGNYPKKISEVYSYCEVQSAYYIRARYYKTRPQQ